MWHDALPSDEDYIEVAASRGCPHLSFADNEEGVSSGSLSDDVLSSCIVRLAEKKKGGGGARPKKGNVIYAHCGCFTLFLT